MVTRNCTMICKGEVDLHGECCTCKQVLLIGCEILGFAVSSHGVKTWKC